MVQNTTQIQAKSVLRKPQCPCYNLVYGNTYVQSQPNTYPNEALISLPVATDYIISNLDYDTNGFQFSIFDNKNPFFDCVMYDLKQAKMLAKHCNDYYFMWKFPYGQLLPLSSQRFNRFCQKYHLDTSIPSINNQYLSNFNLKVRKAHLLYRLKIILQTTKNS